VHEHVDVSKAKPGAHVVFSRHWHAHDARSQTSSTPQPPQPARHSTVHVAVSQRCGLCTALPVPVPQSAGHSYWQVATFHSKAGLLPGGGVDGTALHS
jgi:hypothetical protein